MSAGENNFDVLRLFAAALVLLVHSYPLTGHRPDEPIELLTGYENGGEFAVAIFFVISGYLITSSWINSSSARSFLVKRALRVFPALILAVLLSALVIGGRTPSAAGRSLKVCGYLKSIPHHG